MHTVQYAPEIYNCGEVLTRLYVTKEGFFNKEEAFFTTHVEYEFDFLIILCISGANFLRL